MGAEGGLPPRPLPGPGGWVLLDIGNTRCKIARHGPSGKEGKFPGAWRPRTLTTLPSRWPDLRQWLRQELTGRETLLVSSVVPSLGRGLSHWIEKRGGRVHFATSRSPWSFRLGLRHPETVGSDRLAALEGALTRYAAPLVVVSCGTALTFSVLDAGGVFRGGAIAPGLDLASRILHRGTAQLPEIPLRRPRSLIGRDTGESLRSGLVGGTACLIEELSRRIREELSPGRKAVKVIGTGGSASLLAPLCPGVKAWEPCLVLRGLFSLAGRIRNR